MLRVGQRLGKYRLKRRIARGGFADVFEAYDTLEQITVALKVPFLEKLDREIQADFEREIRISSRLVHPNILALKNADEIDGYLTLAYPLGARSLADRMERRMAVRTALDLSGQLLDGLAHAHEHHVIHCDVKPENVILFADGGLRLADFGLAKQAMRTLQASASGTLGFVAPEQMMGRPSARSDVFSVGLILYRMFAGALPEWPYDWSKAPGRSRLRRNAPELAPVLQRAIEVDARRRFRDAVQMGEAFDVARRAIERRVARLRRRRA